MNYEARIERERQFHNERFASEDDGRQGQLKYYDAIWLCFKKFRAAIAERTKGSVALEYGCGYGQSVIELAEKGAKQSSGIDISDAAIAQGQEHANELGLKNVFLTAGNAEKTPYEDASFDLVYGSGILHHLDLDRSCAEIYRIMKPGGEAIFIEPLGHNPIINLYRKLTPNARTEDEHPLRHRDFKIFSKYFEVDPRFFGLTSLSIAAFPRKAFFYNPLLETTTAIDRLLLKAPGIRWGAWYVLLILKRPNN